MRIHCLQHVPFEDPAGIADWVAARGHRLSSTPLFAVSDLPSQQDFDWLVIMGGPMGVHDEVEHPWLAGEKLFLSDAIKVGKTVIGVCLGAQLIAHVLGARVFPNTHKEIGWLPIALTEQGVRSDLLSGLPERFDVFHWHGDTFDLPAGSVHLARSEGCAHQAFLYQRRVLGLQFHLEATSESVAEIIAHGADELVPAKYIQSAERMLAATAGDYARINDVLFKILDKLAGHE
jgi:GMP synthase-like glutamine amidotransferase